LLIYLNYRLFLKQGTAKKKTRKANWFNFMLVGFRPETLHFSQAKIVEA